MKIIQNTVTKYFFKALISKIHLNINLLKYFFPNLHLGSIQNVSQTLYISFHLFKHIFIVPFNKVAGY